VYYHYTTPASGTDSSRLAILQANRRPQKGKAPFKAPFQPSQYKSSNQFFL
jgi:hypothetical protein